MPESDEAPETKIRASIARGLQYSSSADLNQMRIELETLRSGAQIGSIGAMAAGMITGAALGSIVPGIGTAIGGAIGFAGALFGRNRTKDLQRLINIIDEEIELRKRRGDRGLRATRGGDKVDLI